MQDNIPPLKDELVIDRLSAVQLRPSHDALSKEAADLEIQIRQIKDSLDNLVRMQQRSIEASLLSKANELEEDISMKKFDLRVAHMHLSAINAQVSDDSQYSSSMVKLDIFRLHVLRTF